MREPIRVLFVCLGNICRSPLAEAVVRERARLKGIDHKYHFESAGTGSWHVGNGADQRSATTASAHGLDLDGHRAQQITAGKIGGWQWFVAMDHDNRLDLESMGANPQRLLMMRQFEPGHVVAPDVPDPYYGGAEGFETVYGMLVENADRLLEHLEASV